MQHVAWSFIQYKLFIYVTYRNCCGVHKLWQVGAQLSGWISTSILKFLDRFMFSTTEMALGPWQKQEQHVFLLSSFAWLYTSEDPKQALYIEEITITLLIEAAEMRSMFPRCTFVLHQQLLLWIWRQSNHLQQFIPLQASLSIPS